MPEIDFMGLLHKSTKRDYLARVNDKEYPKAKAAELAKKFEYDYWDGDRRICYGGYKYIPGRWDKIAINLISHYDLDSNSKILDIGCGKGYLLYELSQKLPNSEIYGLDISEYAIENAKPEIKENIIHGSATKLPWPDNFFDLVISINTLHCPYLRFRSCIKGNERVGNDNIYVESYRNESEKRICYIGKLHVKLFIILLLGIGGLRKLVIQVIIHIFILNNQKTTSFKEFLAFVSHFY